MRIVLAAFALFVSSVAATGCDQKPKGDPAACATTGAKSGEDCKACCKNAGSNGYMWSSTCKCL